MTFSPTLISSAMARPYDADALEAETQRIGKRIWSQLERRSPSVFARRWWDERIMGMAMSDEAVKVQMFRFLDVLPTLKTDAAVTRHLQEYFEEVRDRIPAAARFGLDKTRPDTLMGRAVAVNARGAAKSMAQRFIAGTTVHEVAKAIDKLRKKGFGFTLDFLGQAVLSDKESEAYQHVYLDLIAKLSSQVAGWRENPKLDRDDVRPIPRVNVSMKLSALYSQFSPADAEGTAENVKLHLRPLLRAAQKHGAHLHVDMEQYAQKDLTLEIFKQVLTEPEFRDFPDAGIVIQAYLPEAEQDLAALLDWVERRGTPVTVRLVKGAYSDYETILAKARHWPVPVYQQKWQSDENFERQVRFLMQHSAWLRPAIASHNMRSFAHALACAKHFDVPDGAYEIQVLYGMGDEQAELFRDLGHRVRVYVPFGESIAGMAYLVRRLLENTANESFLRRGFTERVPARELFKNPSDMAAVSRRGERTLDLTRARPQTKPQHGNGTNGSNGTNAPEKYRVAGQGSRQAEALEAAPFTNEPLTDFHFAHAREAMKRNLREVAAEFGKTYPLVIDGKRLETSDTFPSPNPSNKSEVVGIVSAADETHVREAIAVAKARSKQWGKLPAEARAAVLRQVAVEMRKRRFELNAWQVFECGKLWTEADGDVAEAIDFCEFYAREMLALDKSRRRNVPGEDSLLAYRPLGVAAVIAPWNSPLAILTGMTVAALVAGNTVILKPAEQSSVIGAKLMQILEAAGAPPGVVNFVPGVGERIGPVILESPDVDVIAFTGSREIGLLMHRQAAAGTPGQRGIQRLILEMGGKNAIIVDDDADLDEAVAGVVASAFGFAGQDCSACSRVVVLESAYDLFVERLVEATRSLKIGPADDPGTRVPPVIDAEAQARIKSIIARARDGGEGRLLVFGTPSELEERGYFVGPHVFADADPTSRLCQEEIFGPVLAVIKARGLDHAFEIVNSTEYALAGGIYSRSPRNLKRAREEIEVGNLYLNRGITGAAVDRHPFGGFRTSGNGVKAGGPKYLEQFMRAVSLTENTMRQGFAPVVNE